MKVRILATGGTIDGIGYDSPRDAPRGRASLIPSLLKQARVTLDCAVEVLMSKDSRFIDDADRDLILNRCRDCEERRIVITHGTVTMAQTAKFLGEMGPQKTIVLTGSVVAGPRPDSDATFNLGFALAAAQLLPAGTYVTMNGRVFPWRNVRKDPQTELFEPEA